METHINTYKLNQGNKEYILTISTVNDSIRISCKNNSDENVSEFSRDFTIEDLKKLDNIFNFIQTPYEALNYIDKALKIQKVGVTEEADTIKINFYLTTKGVVHQLKIPLGESSSGLNFNNVASSSNTQYIQTTNTTSTTSYNIGRNYSFGKNIGFGKQVNSFNESKPYIGPVSDDSNQYLSNTNTTFNQTSTVETTGFNTNNQFIGGNNNFGSGTVDTNIAGGFQTNGTQFLTSEGNTENYFQNLQNIPLSTNITNQIQTTTTQYTGSVTDTNGQYNTSQDLVSELVDGQGANIMAQYTTGVQNLGSQYTTGLDTINQTTNGQFATGEYTTTHYTKGADATNQYSIGANTTTQYTTGVDAINQTINDQFATGEYTTTHYTKGADTTTQYSTGANTTTQYTTGVDTINQITNGQYATDEYKTTQYSKGVDTTTTQYSTGADTNAQYSAGVDANIQYTTNVENIEDFLSKFTAGTQDETPQIGNDEVPDTTATETAQNNDKINQFTDTVKDTTANFGEYKSTSPININFPAGGNNNQYLQSIKTTTQTFQSKNQFTRPSQGFQKPYIKPADNLQEILRPSQGLQKPTDDDLQKKLRPSQGLQKPYIKPADDDLQKILRPSQGLQKPYIKPTDDDLQKILRPSQRSTNQFFQTTKTTTTTTAKNPEKKVSKFTLPLPLVREDPEALREKIRRETTDIQTKIIQKQSDERINKLVGDTSSLKNEHQLIQDKLNALTGQINSYKNQLVLMQKEKEESEVNNLRAENKAMKQQLNELNALRNEAAEVKFLRSQLSELDPLRKKVAEMEVIKGQLGELNALRAKMKELGTVKAQLEELNNLKAQVAQMNILKEQLGELNSLRAKIAELSGVKSQIGELNNLRSQVSQINILKEQIENLSNLKSNAIDAENLRRKIEELENSKMQYEQEIKRLRESQSRVGTVEQNRLIEFKKVSEAKMRSTGMESKQLYFEDKPEQICVKGDIIHNTDELELITRKINKLNQRLTLNLLYKATADSDKASAFHTKCDEARSTLVLVETDKGKRFGGFTTCSWSGDCIDKKDEDAFVFSLDKMQVYENIPGEDAIGCYPKFGPIFLGCQIRIYDNAFSKGGTTFEKGLNFNTEEDYELTGGERAFNVRDIEVYEVIPQ